MADQMMERRQSRYCALGGGGGVLCALGLVVNCCAGVRTQVMARIRPFLGREGQFSDITTVRGTNLTVRGTTTGSSKYRFDRVFTQSASQSDVFSLIKPLLDAAFAGYNATVFA